MWQSQYMYKELFIHYLRGKKKYQLFCILKNTSYQWLWPPPWKRWQAGTGPRALSAKHIRRNCQAAETIARRRMNKEASESRWLLFLKFPRHISVRGIIRLTEGIENRPWRRSVIRSGYLTTMIRRAGAVPIFIRYTPEAGMSNIVVWLPDCLMA